MTNDYETESQRRQRFKMRATPAGRFLWSIGLDYYDTESSARRVAEAAVERCPELAEGGKGSVKGGQL